MSEHGPGKPRRDEARKEARQPTDHGDALLQSILKPECDLCGSPMVEWHCRMMCPACGYQRDCSDP